MYNAHLHLLFKVKIQKAATLLSLAFEYAIFTTYSSTNICFIISRFRTVILFEIFKTIVLFTTWYTNERCKLLEIK